MRRLLRISTTSRNLLVALLCFSCASAPGCDRGADADGDSSTARRATAAAKPATTASEEAAPGAPRQRISEEEVRALVERWRAAQNEGDFEAYRSTYAPKFYGIKRIGARTYTYDREGWIADRRRMFGKEMDVGVDDLEISTSAGSAVVRFEQTWSSGSYRDVGPKQLVVVAGQAGPKIGREEMLQSKIVSSEKGAEPLGPAAFSFASVYDEVPYVFVEHDVSLDLGDRGEIRSVDRGRVARAPVEDVPDKWSDWRGATVALYGPEGRVCSGRVEGFDVVVRMEPHFSSWTIWSGKMDDSGRTSDARVAREVYGQGRPSLAVRLGEVGGSCEGAIWARRADLDAPKLLERVDGARVDPIRDSPIRDSIEKRFRSLEGYRRILSSYRSGEGRADGASGDRAKASSWDDGVEIAAFRHPGESKYYLMATAKAGAGCGEFYGDFLAVFEAPSLEPNAELELLTDAGAPGEYFEPVMGVLLGGAPALVGARRLMRPSGGTWRVVAENDVPSFDCPC